MPDLRQLGNGTAARLWFARTCLALASACASATLAASVWWFVPAPNPWLAFQALRTGERSLGLTVVSIIGLIVTWLGVRLGGASALSRFVLVFNGVACAVSLVPAIQAATLAAQRGVPLRPWQILGLSDNASSGGTVVTIPIGEALLADVYGQGARGERRPIIVAIHGGGWGGGDRAEGEPWHRWLADNGYLVVSIDYTTSPQPNWPRALDDVEQAIQQIRGQAESLGGDPARLALLGRSAGGQLALLAGYESLPPVQAVIAFYAPTDLSGTLDGPANASVYDLPDVVGRFLGGSLADTPEVYALASPINHVHADVPPTLLLHGGHDQLVPVAHSRRLAARLLAAGVEVQYLELPWAEHTYDLEPDGWGGQLSQAALLEFLGRHLRHAGAVGRSAPDPGG